jgi:tetratricopeptide (TPR) repeat protein
VDEAIASFQKALEFNPRYAEAHYNLALIYYERKNYPLAIQHCDQAGKLGIVVDPKFLELLKPHRAEGAKKEAPQKEGAPKEVLPKETPGFIFK